MEKVDAFLFDLDGTLIDTNEVIIRSYDHIFKTYFKNITVTRDEIIAQIGPPLSEIFGRYTSDEALIAKLIDAYRAHYKTIEFSLFKIYDGVLDVIKTLHEKGYKLAIVTSKFKESAYPSFKHFKLDPYFDAFIGLEDVQFPKPDKEPVLKALNALGGVDKAIMIGDNQSDVLSGKNAGIYSAGVAWSIKGKAHLEVVKPDIIFNSMYDIIKLTKEWED